jgi:hypothetical protein
VRAPAESKRGKALSIFAGGLRTSLVALSVNKNARNDRFDRRLTLWPSAVIVSAGSKKSPHPVLPGLEGFLPHPVRISRPSGKANAAKTSFLQAFQRPIDLDPRVAGIGMLWREHAIQGAASLADVPYWRKTKNRLTADIVL